MAEETPALEVEVVEIDGLAPLPPRPVSSSGKNPGETWQRCQGSIRRLDARWWPLWILFALVVVVVVVATAAIATVGVVIYHLIRRLIGILIPAPASNISRTRY